MPRKVRFFLYEVPVNVVQRESNRQPVFFAEEDYLLVCYRYIELNPVRAHPDARPEAYPWSRYRANAPGESDSLLTPHPIYCALAEETLETESLKEIRGCLQTGTPLGNDRFRHGIEQALGVKVGYGARGRPRKVEEASNSVEGQISLDI